MNNRTNIKAVEETPEKLTHEQIVALARRVADSLAFDTEDPNGATAALLLLADEITRNCKDWSHVAQVGFNLREEVYIASDACDEARNAYIAAARAQAQKGGTR